MEEEHKRFQLSLESLQIGFIIINTQKQIEMINSAAKRILFLSDNPAPGIIRSSPKSGASVSLEGVENIFGPSFDLKGSIEKCLGNGLTVDQEEVPLRNLFVHLLLSPITVVEGHPRVIGAVMLIEDQTARKALEKAKDEFFSIASHELRTPLTAIRGNTAMLKTFLAGKFQDQNLVEMIDDIHSASVRLIEIVNDFLDTARIEQGRLKFNKESFDIMILIKEVIEDIGANAREKNLAVELKQPQNIIPQVMADKNRTKQVIINLLGNSIKFTQKGGVFIGLSSNSEFVKVWIKDTGRGIAEEDKDKLFKKFQQTGQGYLTHDATTGTGLGLYISKLLVEGMGGKVGLEESAIDQGSIFSFTLPVAAGMVI